MITGIQTTGAPAHRSPYNYLRGIFPLSKWIKKQETRNRGKYRADVDVLVFARGLPAGYKGEQDVAAPRADAFGVPGGVVVPYASVVWPHHADISEALCF